MALDDSLFTKWFEGPRTYADRLVRTASLARQGGGERLARPSPQSTTPIVHRALVAGSRRDS